MGEFSSGPKDSCSPPPWGALLPVRAHKPLFLAHDPQKKHKFSVPFPQEPRKNVGLLVLFSFPPKLGAEELNL